MLTTKPWRLWPALQLCVVIFACVCFGALTSGVLYHFKVPGFKQLDDFGFIVVGTLSFQGVALLLIGVFLRAHRLNWREAFGLRDPAVKSAILRGLGLAVAIVPVAWLLQSACAGLMEQLGFEPTVQTAVKLLEKIQSVWLLVYLGIFTLVVAPVVEEFVFRGLLYPLSKQLGYPRFAWLGVSFMFALIHQDLTSFVPLFVLALALTWLYEQTDNLLAPIVVHSCFNAAGYTALMLHRFHV